LITLDEEGDRKLVVAERALQSNVITFPPTRSTFFEITFTYDQPLTVEELRLVQDEAEQTISRTLRFLARPTEEYVVYYNPDRSFSTSKEESGNLRDEKKFLVFDEYMPSTNPAYVTADVDADGIPDTSDNCATISNPEQIDIDANGVGDECEDFDFDGIGNVVDNCIDFPNRFQEDADGDNIGDVCDDREDRFTERHTWVPWVGMGVAFLVLVALFVLVGVSPKSKSNDQSL
jgi:hypothetical protein